MQPDWLGRGHAMSWGRAGIAVGLMGFALVGASLLGCASKPAPPPSPTKQEVMSDADRFFEKMKEDEQRHGKGARQDY
jgi:hypothetical protein